MKLTHIRHLAAIAVAAQLAMSASAAPIDNYTDLADAGENTVRYSTDGGTNWTGATDFDAAVSAIASGSGMDNVIELDANTTWSTSLSLTGKNLTVRSVEGDLVRTLQVTDAAAQLTVCGFKSTDCTIRFENVTIDGGAVWTDATDILSSANTGLSCNRLFAIDNSNSGGDSYIFLVFGSGATLRNCQFLGTSLVYTYVRSLPVFETGSLVQDCRGNNILVNIAAGSGGMRWDGGEMTRCSTTANNLLEVRANPNKLVPQRGRLTGGRIVGNRAAQAIIWADSDSSRTFEVYGSPVVTGNWSTAVSPTVIGIKPNNTTTCLQLADDLGRFAVVDITVANPVVGGQFGKALGVDYAGAEHLRFANPVEVDVGGQPVVTNLVGTIDGMNLVWRIADPIISRSIAEADVTGVKAVYGCTGSPVEPEPTVKYGLTTLAKGVDYTVAYEDNVNVGTAKIVLTGIGDYYGTKEILFGIAYFVRYSTDAGANWTQASDFDAALAAVADGVGVDNVIELIEDSDWTSDVLLTGKSLTIRSSPAAEGRRLLQVSDYAAIIRMKGSSSADCLCLFENVIVDGGAKWRYPNTLSSTDNDGIECGQLFYGNNEGIGGSYYVICRVGNGATFRNCALEAVKSQVVNTANSILTGYVRTILEITDGALITDCRGTTSAIENGAGSGGVRMSGGLVTRCYSRSSGIVVANAANPSRNAFWGGSVVGNEVANDGNAAIYVTQPTYFYGSIVVTGNVTSSGFAHNVRPSSARTDYVCQGGSFAPSASVGVTIQAAGTGAKEGDVFGVASVSGTGTSAFFYDGNPRLRGKVSAGKLIWKIQSGLVLIIR